MDDVQICDVLILPQPSSGMTCKYVDSDCKLDSFALPIATTKKTNKLRGP
jgi:hypothetical protein